MKLGYGLLALLAPLLFLNGSLARAQTSPIQVVSSSVTSEFPDGFRFKLQAQSEAEITTIAARFRVGQQTRGVYEYMDFERGTAIDGELFWRTNTSARYIPPGTLIRYRFEIEDAAGNRLETEEEEFIYHDARFQWEEISQGPITVAYHGPVKTRAEAVLDAMVQTLETMGPLLGADTTEPIRVTMYNNYREMLEGLPPGSTTIRRELITEGQAFTNLGTLLVLGGGTLARGTASHELTHILTHRAGDSSFRSVPQWLDEGLAEYGNIEPGFSYDIALEFAIANQRLLPITSMPAMPGNPEDVIIFYGQSRSLVKHMVDQYGPDKMRELMAALKSGKNVEDAIQEVYGVSKLDLENEWRRRIGAPEYTPPEQGRALPTPVPWPTRLPYSLTPQPQAAAIAGGGEPSPTPTPEAAAPPQTQPPAAPAQEATPTPGPDGGEVQDGDPRQGGACSAPLAGRGVTEVSTLALLAGLAALGMRRRKR